MTGGFSNHDGYDGVFLALSDTAELELTTGPSPAQPGGRDDLLVLYGADREQLDDVVGRMSRMDAERVTSENPYWDRNGATFVDADGHLTVIAMTDQSS